jgi:DNA-binding NarL/FixJ family response regulator
MRVLIADDHMLIRQALIGLLKTAWPGWVFEQAGSFQAVKASLDASDIAFLIVDLDMPGMAAADSLRQLRRDYPKIKIAVLTGNDGKSAILDCLRAGIHGYFLKADASQQLLLAVQTILAGGVYVPALLSDIGSDRPDDAAPEPVAVIRPAPHRLTTRQQQVLDLVAEGRSTKQIARVLDLGVGTVKVHLSAAYRALGAHNRVDAVVKNSDRI